MATERLIVDAHGTERVVQPLETVIFNSKKPQVIDEEAILRHLMEARRLHKEMAVGQKEASVRVEAQYPDLPIYIWLNTDDHMGSVQVDYDSLLRDYGIVRDTPNFFMVSNGDEIDNFLVSLGNWASGVYENPITPQQQSILVQRLWGRMDTAGKLLAMSFGNHNNWIGQAGLTFEGTWLSDFRCPILNCGGNLKIGHGDMEYNLAMTHRFWGTSKLNPTNAAKRFMEHADHADADILFLGHTHQAECLWFRGRGADYKYAVIGGTYKVDDTWAAQTGIAGSRGQMGGMCISLDPHKRDITFYDSLVKAQQVFEMQRGIKRLQAMEDPYA